jgi:peptidoglycan-N-acetylglucosamine deacetylase
MNNDPSGKSRLVSITLRFLPLTILLVALLGAVGVRAQQPPPPKPPSPPPRPADGICVAHFQGDRLAAVSLTFDDGLRNQYEVAVPMLNRLGLKATFFIVPGATKDTDAEASTIKPDQVGSMSWEDIKALAAEGHEIGNHSYSHVPLVGATDDQLEIQVNKAYDRIAEVVGKPPLTFAYPGNGFDKHVHDFVMLRHAADREASMNLGGRTDTGTNTVFELAIRNRSWLEVMTHGIDVGYDHFINAGIFEDHLVYLKDHEEQIWTDTFANVARYVQERDAAKIDGHVEKGKAVFTVTCPLNPKLYDQPLTILVPAHWPQNVQATRGGNPLPATTQPGYGPGSGIVDRILIDVVPSEEPVTVTWQE